MAKKLASWVAMIPLAFLAAANYCLFIFPSKFAPSGIDGICTMLQDLLQINMGYFALLANIPLILAAFWVLNRDFAGKTTLFVISFSVSVILLKRADLSAFYLATAQGETSIFAPVAAGVVRGLLYYATLKLNGSAGGIDIISSLIKHKHPHINLMSILFGINMLIAGASYFVYGMRLEPVLCSIVYAFITSTVCDKLRSVEKETIKFEIITGKPEKLCSQLTGKLHQRATILDAHGAYSGKDTKLVLCIADKKAAPHIEALLLEDPGCIVFKSVVNSAITGVHYI